MNKKPTPTQFQNRILEYGTKPADQFAANPLNPRLHPQFQREVMKEALEGIGWLSPVIENKRTGYLIDGHERVMQALENNDPVPYVLVDLSEEEEREALATFDPIGALAQYDQANLTALMTDLQTSGTAIQQMLNNLAARTGILTEDDPNMEWQEMPEFISEDKSGYTVIVHFDNENDISAFAKLIGQTVLTTTKSIWFPARDKQTFKDKAWVSEPDES